MISAHEKPPDGEKEGRLAELKSGHQGTGRVAVVDVRDDDHIGGHIRNSLHVPSETLDASIPELVKKLRDKDVVVFHCALSQQRGPKAALKYVRERERLVGKGLKPLDSKGEVLRDGKEAVDGMEAKRKGIDEDADGEWEDARDAGGAPNTRDTGDPQKVFVLDRGFVGWQEAFGQDESLTEGYRKEIWKNGYWM